MTFTNPLHESFSKGGKLQAVWLFSSDCDSAEILARAGYPVVIIDNEHGVGDLSTLPHLARAVKIGGAEPMLRIASHDPNLLKRVLDAGLRSLMIPQVETPEEAAAIVAACRYPPKGRRGYAAAAVRASGFGTRHAYGEHAVEELFIAVQIESAKGVANAKAIASVDGIDMIFVGPNDLAGNLGCFERLDDAKVHEAIDSVTQAVKSAGKSLGIIPYGSRGAGDLAKRGYALIATAADSLMLRDAAFADITAFREAMGK